MRRAHIAATGICEELPELEVFVVPGGVGATELLTVGTTPSSNLFDQLELVPNIFKQ